MTKHERCFDELQLTFKFDTLCYMFVNEAWKWNWTDHKVILERWSRKNWLYQFTQVENLTNCVTIKWMGHETCN